jgi:hypothetical protein
MPSDAPTGIAQREFAGLRPPSRRWQERPSDYEADLAALNEDIEFAPKCLLPRRSGDAEHLA